MPHRLRILLPVQYGRSCMPRGLLPGSAQAVHMHQAGQRIAAQQHGNVPVTENYHCSSRSAQSTILSLAMILSWARPFWTSIPCKSSALHVARVCLGMPCWKMRLIVMLLWRASTVCASCHWLAAHALQGVRHNSAFKHNTHRYTPGHSLHQAEPGACILSPPMKHWWASCRSC